MEEFEIMSKVSTLPENLKIEVLHYINQLVEGNKEKKKKKPLKFGMMKGTFIMADDFDAPLDDFKEYM